VVVGPEVGELVGSITDGGDGVGTSREKAGGNSSRLFEKAGGKTC
jgi:hypothetical protein